MSAAVARAEKTPAAENDRNQPVCMLSDDQKAIVESNMKTIKAKLDLQDVGILLFKKIFEIAPEAIKLFPKFADVPLGELEQNEHFRHHALQVVEAVELATSMLQEVDDLRDVLISLGSIHVSMGLQDVHFDVVGEALLATLSAGLGELFTREVRDAWSSFYQFVADCMKKGLNESYAAAAGK